MEIPLNILHLTALISVVGFNIRTANAFPHYETGHEKHVTVKVKTIDTGARQKRSVDAFPDELDVELSTDEMHMNFHHLRRNFDIPNKFPVHLMRNGEVKKYSFDSKRKVAYYFDTTSGAAFMAWPKSGENGTFEEFDLYGTFLSDNNEEYFVQPPKDKQSSYTVSKISEKETTISDYVTLADTDAKIMQGKVDNRRNANNPTKRERRQTTTAYEIEIFFVLDYAMYQEWYATTDGQTDRVSATIEYMTQFTAFLLNAINLRYETVTDYGYTIRCLFAGIYIADTADRAPFVENNLYSFGFVADTVLDAFRDWAEANLVNFNYDHAMLFSGYEMGRNDNGVFNPVTAGLAYLPSYYTGGGLAEPGVCGSYRYSINEGGGFNPNMATVGAHELGHNLGSFHDGSSNACSGGYVMEPSSGVSTDPVDNLRLWIFSSCSQEYFNTYINDLNGAEANCMTSRQATNASNLDPYVNDTAGQVYGPDVQCERMQGQGSYLSRGYLNNSYSNLCALMPCAATANDGSVFFHIPWEGTTCGVGKVCQSGSCVESSSAPQVGNETCLFGNVPYNVPGQSSNCSEFLGSDATSYRCYQDSYRESCCTTCEEIKQSNTAYTDCEYGDRFSNCDDLTDSNLYSCNDANFRADCCKSCVDKALDIPDCTYGDRFSNCDNLTDSNLYSCNGADFRAGCCKSCAEKALDIPGCPYGDRYSNCASLSCSSYPVDCCQTCAPSTTSTTTTTTTSSTTTPTTTTTTPTTTTTTTTSTTTPSTTTPTTTTTTTTTTPTTTTTTPTTTTTTPTTTTTTTTPTTTTTTTTTTTPTTTTTTPTTTTTTPTTSTTTTPTTTTTTPTTTTTTTPTTTTTTPTTTTTTPTTTTTTTTPTTTTTTPTTTTPTTTTTTTTPTTTTTTPTTTTTTTTPTTSTPTTTTTTPTTTTTTPTTTTTTTPTTTTTTPTTTTTTPTTTTSTTTPSTTTTTPTTTTTTPTTTTTTTTTMPTTTTTTPTTTTSTPTTTTTTPTTTTTTPSTTTTTPTTTTTTPSTTTTTPTTTTTTPTATTTTPTTTPTTTTTTSTTTTTTTTPTTTTTTPTTTTTTTTPTTTTTTPTATTTTPTTTPTTTTTTPTTTTTTTTPTTTTTTPTTTTTTTTPTTTTTTPTTTTTTPTTTTTTTTPTTTTTTPTTTTTTPSSTTSTNPTTTTTTTTPTTSTTTPTTTTTTTTTSPTTTTTTPTTTTATATSTTTTRRSSSTLRILIVIWIFPINTGNTDLSDPGVQQNIAVVIFIYYRRFLGSRCRGVKIRNLRRGSLIVDYEVEYEDTEDAAAEVTKANIDLVGGKENITLLNETVSATSVQVNDTIVTNETVGSSETVCELFVLSNGPCDENYSCSVEEGTPTCVPEKTQFGISVLIAVSVSLFVFLIFVSVLICLSIRAYRLRKLKHSPDSLTTDVTGIDEHNWPYKRNIVPYGSIGGRQDMPVGYLPYSREEIGHDDYHADRHHKHERDRYSKSQDSQGHRTSYRSDRDRNYRHDKKHNRKHLQNYGYDNRAMDYDQILSASYISKTSYEHR